MCADDLDLAAGYCGSVSGSIFVTVGQPHIQVDSTRETLIMTTNTLDAGNLRDRVQALANGAGIRRWDLGAACSDGYSVQVDRGVQADEGRSAQLDHRAGLEQ